MSIASGATLFGRTVAESLMSAQCAVTRETLGPIDESTGLYPKVLTTMYEGPCRFRFVSPIVREADVQGQSLARQEGVLSLPISGTGRILPDDVATITANPLDPESVGVHMVIRGGHVQSFSTARRFPVEIVS
ncbi:DUF6093 family protein [Subtercola sp. RTI3]|uniref:DUF6093 family protein n=1 Tax=Subtercola sp. RTI3 TaxID=3048639 RepID=UPI002B22D32A|nr:DUF6093 family protein [Subtercola sp. RTI3]MEA9983651.1 DUF6093 family protein [Subtercola sp. RTI3]